MTETCLPIVNWLKNWFTSTDDLIDKTYPIGSIYMSVNSTSPSTLFGGTWVQLTDTFLYASNTADTNSTTSTGGEATHTLTINEIPSHTHSPNATIFESGGTVTTKHHNVNWSAHGSTAINAIKNTGGGQAHNNMPPYMKVYMWKRTA